LSMPVVEGTGVDPVQVCQGSYAPPSASVAGTANRVTVRLCPARPARAFFAKKPHPQGQRAA